MSLRGLLVGTVVMLGTDQELPANPTRITGPPNQSFHSGRKADFLLPIPAPPRWFG